ncbi:MAG TPA: hypothetical protein VGL42_12895 [Opitutaceae bacterium]|jgi:hypothetical protein
MIDSTSPSDRSQRLNATAADAQAPAVRIKPGRDSFSTDQAGNLDDALQNQPEIRPEEVARGQALAADPSYPSSAIIDRVAALIVNSPDLSEDES